MAKRNSTQAAGSPAEMEKKVDEVTMTNEKAGEAKGEDIPSTKMSQDEVFFTILCIYHDEHLENS